MYTNYRMNDENVQDYQKQEQIIKAVSKRFITYGYKRIKTSTFEKYDLYSNINSSINQNDMIKVIDHTGQVLVLRPDVTIPITRKLAQDFSRLPNELRYFYVQDVFRQTFDRTENIESTQAGVEYFCESSPQADAEIIALAIHTLKDLGFNDIKIEMGHAGFFQELIDLLNVTSSEISELKNLIQAKNVVDIDPFLQKLSIDKKLREAVEKIPFLYGNPLEVSKRAKTITLTKKMSEKLDYLINVFENLKMYGLENNIVLDLGLINHMGYYSDVIFQGFVEKFGKPVLMGGRYNQLGNQFGATLPAIGFACQIDPLVKALGDKEKGIPVSIDVKIIYEEGCLHESIVLSSELRERNYSVISLPKQRGTIDKQTSVFNITVKKGTNTLYYSENKTNFADSNELLGLIEAAEEGSN